MDHTGNIIELTEKCSDLRINQYLKSLKNPLTNGQNGEFNVGIDQWMSKVSNILKRGFVLTIDYGGYKDDLYSKSNVKGTLQTYYKHVYGLSPYQKIGQQDLTAKVDFSRVIQAGEENGIGNIGLINQSDFLINNGIDQMQNHLMSINLNSNEKQENVYAIDMLRRVENLGGFKVLIQLKDQDGIDLEKLWTSVSDLEAFAQYTPLKVDDHISILPSQYSHSYIEIDDLFEGFTESSQN